jgi:hypothetical protein
MSEIVGFDLKPSETTSLAEMLEFGLQKHLAKYEYHFYLYAFSKIF